MQIAGLQLYDMDLGELAGALEMVPVQDRALAQVGPEVVDEYASFNVAGRDRPAVKANRAHQLRG